MALLVQKMGHFMKKRGYGVRKRRDYRRLKRYYATIARAPIK
jgi:hypothetical protein